jgi:hypothetical protein
VSGGIAQLFLNLGTRRGGGGVWAASRPGRFYPRERPGTHCTGGWVGAGAGLDRPTGIRSPHLPPRSVVAIPAELSRLAFTVQYKLNICI